MVESNHEGPKAAHQPKSLVSPSGASTRLLMLNYVQDMFFTVVRFSCLLASRVIFYFGAGKICADPKMQVLPTWQHGMPRLCMLDPPCTVDVHPIAMLH